MPALSYSDLKEASQTEYGQEKAKKAIKKYERLKSCRSNWESHWQEIAERIWPSQSRLFQERNQGHNEGDKRNELVFDSTASAALNKFASILDSLLTPMDQTWHGLLPLEPMLQKDRATKLWLEELNRSIFKKRYAPTSNFVSQNQLVYKMLGAYGSGCLFTDEYRGPRGEKGFRYKNIHLSEVFFLENHQGIVDEALRYYSATASQIAERFPNSVPKRILDCLKKDPDEKFWLIHCVMPRRNYDPERRDVEGMLYEQYYVSVEGEFLLEESGYSTFPYGVSRYEQVPGEVYGRSPAMEALPAIKTLNEEKKTLLTHGHRAVAPPLFAHDDGVLDTYNIRPGALNMGGVSADGKLLVHPMPVGNIFVGKDLMDDERAVINDLFLVPLFQLLEKNPQMTATEVVERMKEKGILLAPTVGRQYNEYHARVIEREIDLELSQNPMLASAMPPVFEEAGAEFKIRYESPMARMQRTEEVAGFMRTVETALNIATQTQNPAPLDHFNWDVIMPEIAEIGGVPSRWMNGPEEIQAIREGRAQAAEDEAAVQAAPGAAALIKAQAKAQESAV